MLVLRVNITTKGPINNHVLTGAKCDLNKRKGATNCFCIHKTGHCALKGNSHQKRSVANMIELPLKSFLVYHSPMFEAWKVPKRPVEVSCDVTQHLVEYWTAVGTRTNSSGMRTHTGQYSRLPCMHAYRNRTETDDVTAHLRCTKATLHRLLEGFSFPNLPNILGNNFSISTSTPARLISESKIW